MLYTIKAMLLTKDAEAAEKLAETLSSMCELGLSCELDDNIVMASQSYDIPESTHPNEDVRLTNTILAEIERREKFEEKLNSLGAPYTIIDAETCTGEITAESYCKALTKQSLLNQIFVMERYIDMWQGNAGSYELIDSAKTMVYFAKLALFNS